MTPSDSGHIADDRGGARCRGLSGIRHFKHGSVDQIEREAVLEGIRGQPNAIARMPDGRLVVTGRAGAARSRSSKPPSSLPR
jgi:hypothetical protein